MKEINTIRFATTKMLVAISLVVIGSSSCNKKPNNNNTTPNTPSTSQIPCTITTTTSIPSGSYHISCNMRVQSPATLTIQPGATLIFDQDASLTIESGATIIAVGTSAAPIVMKGSSSTKGYWKGVSIFSKSINNQLAYCTISDAGGNTYGNIELRNGTVGINNCTIFNSSYAGVFTMGDNGNDYAGMDGTIFTSFNNNTITNCGTFPIKTTLSCAGTIGDGNKLAGNTNDYIALRKQSNSTGVKVDVTVGPKSVPYLIFQSGGDDGIEIAQNLTILPGTIIVIDQSMMLLTIGTGSINAIGTTINPITFKGKETKAGYWNFIGIVTNNSKNVFSYCNFSDGGNNTGAYANGILKIYDYTESDHNVHPNITVSHCSFNRSATAGIDLTYNSAYGASPNYNSDIASSNTFTACNPSIKF